MNRHSRYLLIPFAAALVMLALGIVHLRAFGSVASDDTAVVVGRPPRIQPDYADTVIPANIAPLNFRIQEDGARYRVRIRSERGRPVEIVSRSATIKIPRKRWRALLDVNRARRLTFEVSVESASGAQDARRSWRRFDSFAVFVAQEEIDDYVVYRRIHPVHAAWREMGIYQRDLTGFDESCVVSSDYFAGGCVNCHTFCNNQTDTMLISTRSGKYTSAAIVLRDGALRKIGTKFGYSSWHPTGKILTYSVNQVVLFLHAAGEEVRDVLDLDSLLAYYVVDAETVRTAPGIAQKDRLETYPTWSPDGRFLYFCSAPLSWSDRTKIPADYNEIRYDLMRIAYDVERDAWGEPETVLAAADTGRSILLPRISPDGRWLLFCMCDYGCFPVYQHSSDLYIMDLEAAKERGRYEYRRLQINSDESESWHSWSANSRWIVFSSKRANGTFTRLYISHVDDEGVAGKPLLLPQEDPTAYDSCLWTYSVPELVTSPVPMTKEKLGRVIRGSRHVPIEMPVTMATPKAGQAPAAPYLSTRE